MSSFSASFQSVLTLPSTPLLVSSHQYKYPSSAVTTSFHVPSFFQPGHLTHLGSYSPNQIFLVCAIPRPVLLLAADSFLLFLNSHTPCCHPYSSTDIFLPLLATSTSTPTRLLFENRLQNKNSQSPAQILPEK